MKIVFFEAEQKLDLDAVRAPLLAAGHDFTMHPDGKSLLEGLRGISCDLLLIHAPIWRTGFATDCQSMDRCPTAFARPGVEGQPAR